MHLGERYQIVTSLTVMVVVGVLLVLGVPGAEARPLYQTVPTMPPPTKSPTVTQPVPTSNPPGNTPTHSPANTATSFVQPSATFAQATSLPPTQTVEGVASATAELASSPSATLLAVTAKPTVYPSQTAVAGGNTVPQLAASEQPSPTATDLAATVGGAGGISMVWVFGLILAGAVVMLAVLLARWVQARRKEQKGGKGS
jgi:hypothetical protein